MSTAGSASNSARGALGARDVGGDALEARVRLLGAQLREHGVDARLRRAR